MIDFTGQVAVVTGAGRGLGRLYALELARRGAAVVVDDIGGTTDGHGADPTVADEVVAEIASAGGTAVACHESVATPGGGEAVVRTALDRWGRLDAVVSNAGTFHTADFEDLTPDDWRRMLAVHLDGTFFGTRAAARSMAPRGSGSIVNIASICGISGCAGYPHYSAAKGGILAFTRAVAKELIVQGVRVNAIAPGFIETPTTAITSSRLQQSLRLQTPLGRYGRPEEIAATVAFLASDDASLFVGQTLSPNGGIITV